MNETNPFLSPQWVGLSYEYFAGDSESLLVSLRMGERLVGIAPLAISKGGHPVVHFAVDPLLTDYADLILAPESRAGAVQAVVEAMRDRMVGKEFGVFLSPVRGDSPNLLLLEKALGGQKSLASEHLFLHLPSSVDEFTYRVMRAADHKTLLKKADKLMRSHEVEIEVLVSPLEVSENLDDILWMFVSESPQKKEFLSTEREAFLREVLPLVARGDACRLYYLKVDGMRTAGHIALESTNSTLIYMSAEGAHHQSLSPGVLLLRSVIENAIERGLSFVDFGRGGEAYKRRFGAKEGKVYRFTAGRVPTEAMAGGKPPNAMTI